MGAASADDGLILGSFCGPLESFDDADGKLIADADVNFCRDLLIDDFNGLAL